MPDLLDAFADSEMDVFVGATRVLSSIDQVASAIAWYTEHPGSVYVEQSGAGWKWSPAHSGGLYPLHRVVARFARIDHTRARWVGVVRDGRDTRRRRRSDFWRRREAGDVRPTENRYFGHSWNAASRDELRGPRRTSGWLAW